MNENKPDYKPLSIALNIHAAACPFFILAYYLSMLSFSDSGHSNDAVGVACLIFIVIGIGAVPPLAFSSIPFAFMLGYAKDPIIKRSKIIKLLILSDIMFIVIQWLCPELFYVKINEAIPVCFSVIYIIVSLVLITKLFPLEKENG